ncbi:MAG: sugar ABC transporter permease [Armatimonadetes bacterium]|nr:sugar ABC transporter permease [Armatimonadota bacterium]
MGRNVSRWAILLYLLPAGILTGTLVLLPNLYSLYLAFTNHSLYHFEEYDWVGIRNFYRIVTGPEIHTFLQVFLWTLVWATVSVAGAMAIGLALALLLNTPKLRGRNLLRTLFIFPWAMPSFISVLMWQGLLNSHLGAVNRILYHFHAGPIAWLDDPFWAKISVLMVNLWLSFPFMMSVLLGALQSIPAELYEAASVDGASPWQRFFKITVPQLRSAVLPVAITSFAFNFNQFGGIYLLTGGGPPLLASQAGATDILVTYSYKLAFDQFRFGMACAYSVIIFAVVASISSVNFKLTGAFKDVD